jgi:hypothetical protein
MDGIITAHEILHSVHLSKEKGIMLKLDSFKKFSDLLRVRVFLTNGCYGLLRFFGEEGLSSQ